MISEWMDGGELEGPVSDERRWLGIASSCVNALQALLAAGIIHRDVKPKNLLHRRADDRIKLNSWLTAPTAELVRKIGAAEVTPSE